MGSALYLLRAQGQGGLATHWEARRCVAIGWSTLAGSGTRSYGGGTATVLLVSITVSWVANGQWINFFVAILFLLLLLLIWILQDLVAHIGELRV